MAKIIIDFFYKIFKIKRAVCKSVGVADFKGRLILYTERDLVEISKQDIDFIKNYKGYFPKK